MRGLLVLAVAALACGLAAAAFARGEEHFGAEPLSTANYAEWPGIETIVNDPHRVYHTWVNGNEYFYYRGGTVALNAFLKQFAKTGGEPREVVLQPGPAEAKTFQGEPVAYDWMLHVVGGIAKHMTTLPEGDKVWNKQPVVHVHVGESIKLDALEVPAGVKVVGLKELKARYRDALDSTDQTVRGWTCGSLAELDAYDEENVAAIAQMLKDEQDWVRLNAAGALATFGQRGKAALPALREARDGAGEELAKRIDETVQEIEKAAPDQAAAERQYKTLVEIEKFVEAKKER